MKEEYEKPQVSMSSQTRGVVPAAVEIAFPALVVGVGMGTSIKSMLNDGRLLHSFNKLQECNVAEASV